MCETGEIGELQVTGVLNSCDVTSNTKYTLITVVSCVYAFIITEVVTNKNESFIEVYSPNYVNTIITQDFKLQSYIKHQQDPQTSDSTNMKGKTIGENGSIKCCKSNQSTVYNSGKFNYVTGHKSPADTSATTTGRTATHKQRWCCVSSGYTASD